MISHQDDEHETLKFYGFREKRKKKRVKKMRLHQRERNDGEAPRHRD